MQTVKPFTLTEEELEARLVVSEGILCDITGGTMFSLGTREFAISAMLRSSVFQV